MGSIRKHIFLFQLLKKKNNVGTRDLFLNEITNKPIKIYMVGDLIASVQQRNFKYFTVTSLNIKWCSDWDSWLLLFYFVILHSSERQELALYVSNCFEWEKKKEFIWLRIHFLILDFFIAFQVERIVNFIWFIYGIKNRIQHIYTTDNTYTFILYSKKENIFLC